MRGDIGGAKPVPVRQTDRRARIPGRIVNQKGSGDYDPGLQRHHLLPRQLLGQRCFGDMFEELGRNPVGFDDFRSNGLLLPSTEAASLRLGLPLHRGPHRRYNEMVIERVGQVESSWQAMRGEDAEQAFIEAVMRLRLLQSALRRRLLSERRRLVLNRKDPLGTGYDFSDLDAMAQALWDAT